MYSISNFLTQIKNSQAVNKDHVLVPYSGTIFQIANILKIKGFVSEVSKKKRKEKKSEFDFLMVALKFEDGRGAIDGIKLISKPSRRVYIKASEIRPVRSGYGISVISTPKGIMTGEDAKKQKLGGEIICEVW